MRKRRVVLAPEALADLAAISTWLREEASAAVAQRYLARIKKRLAGLAHASERGTVRDDVAKGLRVIGIAASASVAFRVQDDRVTVLRVVYGGQNWQSVLTTESDDD
ncbi:type II toxin-antitoxin system RelE/ParE family toxin [Devosia ginsengisoli]|uniref:type II toxin-antitoxin system RelE/ParE family toxin n=1 Tax=Devosia ginsengisoli TaxID=400770 RepID=UPI0026F28549|nr:type II toxin-antitoxin system RelE/ParE family toxin [Devosia ginsengisoli]MCR6672682.1 type II toxin-antitoxin system RelE/ParE family toxin [Devosia ginsengisoli]